MFNSIKTTAIAAALAVSAGAAGAATIDFTAAATGGTGAFADGLTWSLSAQNGTLNNVHGWDGGPVPASGGALAFERDGYGVSASDNHDEISEGLQQSITLSFSKAVMLTAASFVDVFGPEFARIAVGGTDVAFAGATGEAGGFTYRDGLSLVSDRFTFRSSEADDNGLIGDVALASVEFSTLSQVAPVPVPAAGLLLLGGLGALGALRGRRRAD